jgi:hypothetical protein
MASVEEFGIVAGRRWGGVLDRISRRTYENAVRLHRGEQEQFARRAAAALRAREEVADLKKRIARKQGDSSVPWVNVFDERTIQAA